MICRSNRKRGVYNVHVLFLFNQLCAIYKLLWWVWWTMGRPIAGWRILEFPVVCALQYKYYQYCWMKNTGASSIVCFTILVLPELLDEEYWSFQYRVFYNTSITSIVGWRILELPVLCIDQRFWYSSIVYARYWYIQYCIYMILDFRYCNITILVFLVLYSVTILVLPVL